MNLKALRRPHQRGWTTTRVTQQQRPRRQIAAVRPLPGAPRLTASWTVAGDGRLVLAWSLEPERRPRPLATRKRGSDA
jgi:hypothetical protein